jgi:hypothetical protein
MKLEIRRIENTRLTCPPSWSDWFPPGCDLSRLIGRPTTPLADTIATALASQAS